MLGGYLAPPGILNIPDSHVLGYGAYSSVYCMTRFKAVGCME